jgi:predicted transglutaminase-like cysteine proteinase
MARCTSTTLLFSILAAVLLSGNADARSRLPAASNAPAPIAEASPTLAPFQHVRFCLRYPSECKSDPTENARIELTTENSELLNRVNRSVNAAIIPTLKRYGTDLQDGWTIAPVIGDCNDYAVTKRHELHQSGLPAKALRLSVVKTATGTGHVVLIAITTKGDLVLDNLTDAIRPWQTTDYHWLKIQSATDAGFWYQVKATGITLSQTERTPGSADP